MENDSIPYLFSAKHLDSLEIPVTQSEQYTSWKLNDPPNEIFHQFSLCLLAPCTIEIAVSWFVSNRIWKILAIFCACFFMLGRIFPRYSRIRITDLMFYMLGFGAKPSALTRRELLILTLYGLAIISLLNFLETQQMALGTVFYQRSCYRSVQEVYSSGLRVKWHPKLKPFITPVFDPDLLETFVCDNYAVLDLSSKNYAYLVGCEAGRKVSKSAANYNPDLDVFMVKLIEQPIVWFRTLAEVSPESGIYEHEMQMKIAKTYNRNYVPGPADSQVDRDEWLRISSFLAHFYMLSFVLFIVECVSHAVTKENVAKVLKAIHRVKVSTRPKVVKCLKCKK